MKMKLFGLALLVLLAWTSLAHAWSYTFQWSWTMIAGSGTVTHYAWCYNGGVLSNGSAWVSVVGFPPSPTSVAYPYIVNGQKIIWLDSQGKVTGPPTSHGATAHNISLLSSNLLYIKITCTL